MSAGQHNEARIYGVLGASGSGKSLWLKSTLLKPRPNKLLVWNFMHEKGYTDLCTTLSTQSLKEVANACKKPRFAVEYLPDTHGDLEQQFATFCRIAHAVPDLTAVVEELSYVTTATHAPPAWRALCVTGRHKGITIIGVSQRPTSVDKDFFSQCTTIHAGRLNTLRDQTTMAGMLNVTVEQYKALAPLEWIERNMSTGETSRGRVKIPASKPKR